VRLFGTLTGAIVSADRAEWLTPPFDLAFSTAGLPTFRTANVDLYQPGAFGGTVFPWSQHPAEGAAWERPHVIAGAVQEDSTATLLAYVRAKSGSALTAAAVSQMAYTVTDTLTRTAVPGHESVALDKNAILRAVADEDDDARWNRAGSFNFVHELAASAWPTAGRTYRYECLIVETGGAEYYVLADLVCQSVLRS
jgi:hypothetical protein